VEEREGGKDKMPHLRKKKKGLMKEAMGVGVGLTGASVGLGVGATVAGRAGGVGTAGITTFSSYMPTMGAVAGAGMAVGMLGEINPRKKRKVKRDRNSVY
jgi:L-aminopeptidase/D-esterase-like protein